MIKDLLLIMSSYIGLIVLFFVGINFFSGGWLFTWLKVKLSRNKKVFVTVIQTTNDYFRSGVVDKGFLVFKDNVNEERRIVIDKDSIIRSIGINFISVDDETNSVLKRDLKGVSGFDASKMSNLYTRALTKPAIYDNKEKIMLVIMIVLLISVAVLGFLVYQQSTRVDQILTIVKTVGGNVKSLV